MNAGRDYRKAKAHAQANADRTQTARVLVLYNGVWWIDLYDAEAAERGAYRDKEIVQPKQENKL
jgi:hypothetical protein